MVTDCKHKQIYLGLDAAYCPACKCSFRPWSAEYKQALKGGKNCEHDWSVLWTGDFKLINYCRLCHQEKPISDLFTLEYHCSSVREILAEYEQSASSSRSPFRKQEFEAAITQRKQQLRYLEQQIAVLGDKSEPEISPSTDPEPDVLGDKSEPEISPSTDPEPDVLGDKSEPEISPSKMRRHKGEGSGSVHWKVVTRGDKEYPQAWYHYEIWEKGDRLAKKSKYIPKRLLAKVQELEAKKAPVQEIIKLLNKTL